MGYEKNEDFARAAEDVRAVHDNETPTATVNATEGVEATPKSPFPEGSVFGELLAAMIRGSLEAAAEEAAQQAEDEIFDDATDSFAVAQKLTDMSTGAERFADSLELTGMSEVAFFVREAAKSVRKGAKVARREARESLDDLADAAGDD